MLAEPLPAFPMQISRIQLHLSTATQHPFLYLRYHGRHRAHPDHADDYLKRLVRATFLRPSPWLPSLLLVQIPILSLPVPSREWRSRSTVLSGNR